MVNLTLSRKNTGRVFSVRVLRHKRHEFTAGSRASEGTVAKIEGFAKALSPQELAATPADLQSRASIADSSQSGNSLFDGLKSFDAAYPVSSQDDTLSKSNPYPSSVGQNIASRDLEDLPPAAGFLPLSFSRSRPYQVLQV